MTLKPQEGHLSEEKKGEKCELCKTWRGTKNHEGKCDKMSKPEVIRERKRRGREQQTGLNQMTVGFYILLPSTPSSSSSPWLRWDELSLLTLCHVVVVTRRKKKNWRYRLPRSERKSGAESGGLGVVMFPWLAGVSRRYARFRRCREGVKLDALNIDGMPGICWIVRVGHFVLQIRRL